MSHFKSEFKFSIFRTTISSLFAFALSFISDNALGDSDGNVAKLELEGFTGDFSGGDGYGMLRLLGGNKAIFFGSIYGHYQDATNNGIVGAGLGYRNTLKVDDILGAYIYFDRNFLRDNDFSDRSFWVVNPGFELMGKSWDFHVNGYFPTDDKQWQTRDGWADQFGVYQYERLQGHTMYNKHMSEYGNLGQGFDLSLGAAIPYISRAKIYLGGYYFDQDDGSKITGVFGKLNFAVTANSAITVTDTYDNVKHNTFTVGLKLTFGGHNSVKNTVDNISERLLDTPQRNWTAQNYGLSVPVNKTSRVYATSGSGFDKELDNIYSFVPNNSSDPDPNADGTFEHPYSYDQFNQNTIDQIGANANIFFGGSGVATMGNVNILPGQALYGRTSDFIRPADGDERVELDGSLNLMGNNLLEALRVENENGIYQKGINFMNSETTAYMNNVDVGDKNNVMKSYSIGIYASSIGLIDLQNCRIYAANSNHGGTTYGIEMIAGRININNSVISSIDNLAGGSSQNGTSYGIYADNSSLDIANSVISAQSITSAGDSSNATSYGIYANNLTNVDISNNSIVNSQSGATAGNDFSTTVSQAYGVLLDNNSTANINGSTVTVASTGYAKDSEQSSGYGLYAAHNSSINFENSALDVSNTGNADTSGIGIANSYGIYIDNSYLIAKGSTVKSNSTAESIGKGYGIFAVDGAYATIENSSISGKGTLIDGSGITGDGYGIYAENAAINIVSSTIAGEGSNDAYGIYAKDNDVINLLDINSVLIAHNDGSAGNAIGIYSADLSNNFVNDNYKYSTYDVSGGSNTHNWSPDPL